MRDLFVILFASSIVIACILALNIATSDKKTKHRQEYRIGITGALLFMFISWLVVYIANIHPFVNPEFKKEKRPDFYR
ncbi:uncharacterized protein VICG_01794 [Vittaforma corneae ATCC 50505]|uniref:Uncharacterized protein n=1 Tax=Vittaforma corneae (strain ATCC 50505) TaxID=993615 RepID=L2GL30_VITCO|nr:uncharacterized protein VICG_01794 [Vittaforma corneae ATCC 50505]ELA41195.1 hypothetical protein VICG_01794 [Vittaforma corneae ATCC 50505]